MGSQFTPTGNNQPPSTGVTNDASLTPTAFRVDPTTKRLLVDGVGGVSRSSRSSQATTISASTAETTIITATASEYHDIIAVVVSNTSTSTNTRIDFRDDTAGTVIFSLMSIGGGSPVGFSIPNEAIPQTATNKNWTAQCATSTTDVRIFAFYEKNTT